MASGIEYGRVQEYLAGLVPERPAEMVAMEEYAREKRFPIIGPAAGYFCYQVARIIGARNIFELGSGFGYSTAWFARAAKENGGGTVYHTVWDQELSDMARGHLAALGFDGLVKYHVAEAVQTLRETPGRFDLIFNDIDKDGYPDSLPVIEEKLRPGGVLIVDNMLLHGRVFDEENESPSALGVRGITRLATRGDGWVTTVVPIRDGLLLAWRK
jgi:caffeoyl-CoA O-methyltransferase